MERKGKRERERERPAGYIRQLGVKTLTEKPDAVACDIAIAGAMRRLVRDAVTAPAPLLLWRRQFSVFFNRSLHFRS